MTVKHSLRSCPSGEGRGLGSGLGKVHIHDTLDRHLYRRLYKYYWHISKIVDKNFYESIFN